jgi:hypothetical protein
MGDPEDSGTLCRALSWISSPAATESKLGFPVSSTQRRFPSWKTRGYEPAFPELVLRLIAWVSARTVSFAMRATSSAPFLTFLSGLRYHPLSRESGVFLVAVRQDRRHNMVVGPVGGVAFQLSTSISTTRAIVRGIRYAWLGLRKTRPP